MVVILVEEGSEMLSQYVKVLDVAFKQDNSKNDYTAVVDFSRDANETRFFLIDVKSKNIVYEWFTSHGSGSGSVERATSFSNTLNSHKSSLGVYKTGATYQSSKVGFARRLIGLDKTNNNAEKRGIVLHSAQYVTEEYVKKHGNPGRSQGCITLDPKVYRDIIAKLKPGSFITVID